MLPNTALASVLSGLGLVCLVLGRPTVATGLGVATLLLGGVSLAEHITGLDAGIDTLLLHREWGQNATVAPGRIGPPASAAFTVIGIATVLSSYRRTPRIVATSGVLVAGLAMLSLVGHMYGADPLFTLPRLTAIAGSTSLMLLCLGLGLVASVPFGEVLNGLVGDSGSAKLVRRAVPAIVLIPIALGLARMWAHERELVDFAFGTALRTLVEIFLLLGLLWWCARMIRRHELALRASEADLRIQSARLAAIIESSDDAIVSKDLDGMIQSWNQSAERMFGYPAAEAVGKHISLIVPPERRLEENDVLARLRLGQKVDHFETERMTKEGGRLIISLTVSPIRDPTGRIIGASKVARDITERRRAEADRTMLLESERSARAQAERASRLKDEFLATLSHELRTPLNAVLGWANILRKTPPSEETLTQGLAVIERNARMQSQLIADLLDMSRIISGKMRLDVQAVTLAVVIDAAMEAVRPAANAKRVALQSVVEPFSDSVQGDPVRLQQIVWNLLSNAVKFTPSGGRVQLICSRVQSHIEIAVSDTGQGIKAEFLPHVFERFRQADSSPSRSHGGLGLGLAIVKQLIELHGGSVRAQSEGEGKGSTFVLHLPLAAVRMNTRDTDAARSAFDTTAAPVAPTPMLAGIRVLVVDDENDAGEVVKRVLELYDAQVVLTASASEALATVRRSAPDVILSDIGMPGQDGYQFMRAVRQMGISVPAAALTAFARTEDRMRALQAGFQTHIAKPVEPSELIAAVAALANKAV